MASSQRYEIAPVSFVHAGGTLNLQQLERIGLSNNSRYTRVRPGGTVDSKAHALSRANPRIQFATKDLTTLFGTVSPSLGLCVTGAATFRLLEREECATFLTGATHVTVTGDTGFVLPVSLEADEQSDEGALAVCEYVPYASDSATTPITLTDSVDMDAAPAAAFSSLFYLGPVYHNSVEIPGVRRSSVQFGINFASSAKSPGPYHDTGSIVDRNPELRFRVAKVDAAVVSNHFIRALTSNVSMYFYQSGASTDRVAKATASHVKVFCQAGAIEEADIGGEAGQDAMVEFIIRPTGTIGLSVSSAIP